MRVPIEMNAQEKATLTNCRNYLLEDLDPTKTFLSQLYCASIVTEDQKERVENQTTRQDKVIVLLDILPRRGPRAFRKFIDVLETDYHWIREKLVNELQTQEYQKRIMDAIEDRMKKSGEFLRDKDYIVKIIRETILPFLLEELHSSPSGSPSSRSDQSMKDLLTNHLLPLLGGSASKMKLEAHQEMLFDKTVDIIDQLKEKCCATLGFSSESCAEDSLPNLIERRLLELKAEVTLLRKENKKTKKTEEKLTADNQKLKTDNTTLKNDVKKYKTDSQGAKNELKKLKDELQKSKTENTKLKQEVKILKEALNDAGVDLRISSDFCAS